MSTFAQRTILLVEDSQPMRHMLDQVLRTAGYRVLVASDAIEAAGHWSRDAASIDLVLADILLEGISGPELVRKFRAARPGLKAIIITGSHDSTVLDMIDLADAQVFLAKPFDHRALLLAMSKGMSQEV